MPNLVVSLTFDPNSPNSLESTRPPQSNSDADRGIAAEPPWENSLPYPLSTGGGASSSLKPCGGSTSKKGGNGKTLSDYVKEWIERRVESGVPRSRCFLPFLVHAPKAVKCLLCHKFINAGEEVSCSVHCCEGGYHLKCVKKRLGISNVKKFRCPQHECFLCKKKQIWRCMRCIIASHDQCAPWPDEVIHIKHLTGQVVCWRHDTDWRLDKKEIFCRLPLPYIDEEFKSELTLKEIENRMKPPPYDHIRRNIYLVKKKRDDVDSIGCTCGSVCYEECVCRGLFVSCTKDCRCSENCTNRPFRKEKRIKIVKTQHCGWGVEAAETINEGDFIIEYVGEVIDDALCARRLWDLQNRGTEDFYLCEVGKDFTIDATFKGNASRFINHSCNPNCILDKWLVDGEVRLGVFADRHIGVGEPLTYNYRTISYGPDAKCHCGSSNCRGFLGSKRKIGKVNSCWVPSVRGLFSYHSAVQGATLSCGLPVTLNNNKVKGDRRYFHLS